MATIVPICYICNRDFLAWIHVKTHLSACVKRSGNPETAVWDQAHSPKSRSRNLCTCDGALIYKYWRWTKCHPTRSASATSSFEPVQGGGEKNGLVNGIRKEEIGEWDKKGGHCTTSKSRPWKRRAESKKQRTANPIPSLNARPDH